MSGLSLPQTSWRTYSYGCLMIRSTMAPKVSAAEAEKSQERPSTTALREVTKFAKVVLSIAAI